ncbi:FixH family protein [Nitratireductor aquimarinus]|uniref:FixH family protein n=1 Tax=Nitratireductor aquimarinus TaxID=889300 RepID=A0ABU4ANM1_9HYPH|nr:MULTISPECIES: FixH family protein [Alphaproteobacteria]MBY6020477.1 FixH family protein [Nitratireductor sp. DP7N14-4]MBN7755691.1 FixH family protein [Nitratireductor aquimarinus]MBN7763229.1 FixH family protein [Nitratireductor aquibiodomus]MBN7776057.1 FixH family protein [Nitratireductor pacificus]MBN7780721.1 FixH family protein [Nitratireductor pacificus]
MSSAQKQKVFTGWHMLAIMIAFFGVIIAVNLTMAFYANSSWTGLIVKNSYVASQTFNERAAEGRAQAALGWNGDLIVEDGAITYRLTDASGSLIPLDGVKLIMHRPVTADEDTTLELERRPDGAFGVDHGPGDGTWVVSITAEAGLDHPYRDVRRIVIKDGALR